MNEIRLNTIPLEINLLQLEEAVRDHRILLRTLLLTMVLAVGTGTVGWLGYNTFSENNRLSAELTSVNASIDELQMQLTLNPSASVETPMTLWLDMPKSLENYRPRTTVLLDQIKQLLPVKADLFSLTYSDGGKLQVVAQFAEMENVITFTREIEKSNTFRFVRIASMNNIASTQSETDVVDPATPDRTSKLPLLEVTLDLEYTAFSEQRQGGTP